MENITSIWLISVHILDLSLFLSIASDKSQYTIEKAKLIPRLYSFERLA